MINFAKAYGEWSNERIQHITRLVALCVLIVMQTGQWAFGQTIICVDTPADEYGVFGSGCSLREAIQAANTNAAFGGCRAGSGADTIMLPAATYTLTILGTNEDANATGDLDITSSLNIVGAGADVTIIDAAGIDRVFDLENVSSAITVTISDLTITGGVNDFGGGLAMRNEQGTMTLDRCTIDQNSTGVGLRQGGGIWSVGTVIVNDSTVSRNTAYSGGGIQNYIGAITLNNTTISGNTAGYGGAIAHANHGPLTVLNNCTVSDNFSPSGSRRGLYAIEGTFKLRNTILNNGNSPTHNGNCDFYPPYTTLVSLDYNISSDLSCQCIGVGCVSGGLNRPSDRNNTPAHLAPLALNSPGRTETHALCTGSGAPHSSCGDRSPALDGASLDCPPADQRGVARPQDGDGNGSVLCDIGAYEVGTSPAGGCILPPSGIVAWWPMDEIAGATRLQDIIGANNARPFASLPVGASQGPQAVAGTVKGAIHFPKFGNGLSGARVTTQQPTLANIGAADFTIDAWVNFSPGGPANRGRYIVNRFGSNKGLALYIVSPGVADNERLRFQWGDGVISSSVQSISPMTPGWHHVAVSFARNAGISPLDIRLYVDGIQTGQQTGALPGSLVNYGFIEVGSPQSTIDLPITIDELEIFNRALCACEIQEIFNAGSAGKCKTVVSASSSKYCISGVSTGAGWSWSVGSRIGSVANGAVPPGGSANQLASAWVASMNAAGVSAAQQGNCFRISPGNQTLTVETCTVTGNPTGCSFNPTVIEVSEATIPTVSAWGLIVLTLLLLSAAKIYFHKYRTAHRRRSAVPVRF